MMRGSVNIATSKEGLNNPAGQLSIVAVLSASLFFYILAICTNCAAQTFRDYSISTTQQIAMRSQLETPYVRSVVCIDNQLKGFFEHSKYLDHANTRYKTKPDELFTYEPFFPEGSMGECSGIVVYESMLLSVKQEAPRKRITFETPVLDIPAREFKLIANFADLDSFDMKKAYLGNVLK